MKRTALLLALASFSAGCFGACGSGSESTSSGTSETTTATTGGTATTPEETPPPETASTEPTIVDGPDACTTDADCVPGGCCHPTTCVARGNAPACGDSICTTDCRYGTLDCGGGCLCHAGHCAARLSQLPNIPGIDAVQ